MLMIMIYNDLNIMLVPFCILIACIDTWLLLASVRWLLSRFHSPQPTRIRLALQELTDPVPELLGSFLSSSSSSLSSSSSSSLGSSSSSSSGISEGYYCVNSALWFTNNTCSGAPMQTDQVCYFVTSDEIVYGGFDPTPLGECGQSSGSSSYKYTALLSFHGADNTCGGGC